MPFVIYLQQIIHRFAVDQKKRSGYVQHSYSWSDIMSSKTVFEILEQLEKILKDKPNYNKLLGGSGYRNGYEDGYKNAFKRFKPFRDDILKKDADKKDLDKSK